MIRAYDVTFYTLSDGTDRKVIEAENIEQVKEIIRKSYNGTGEILTYHLAPLDVEFWWYDGDGAEHSNTASFMFEREVNKFIADVVSGTAMTYDGYSIEACHFQGQDYEAIRS